MIRSRVKTRGIDEQNVTFTSLPGKINMNVAWWTARVMMICPFIALLVYITGYSSTSVVQKSDVSGKSSTSNTGNPCLDEPMSHPGVPPFKRRIDLGYILEKEKMQYGAELGVQRGLYSAKTLKVWKSCREYILVDLWAPQENYLDGANRDQKAQNGLYQETLGNTNEWSKKIKVCRNYTTVCATTVPDGSLDFVYVDARHDFKGVYEDVSKWWPKLRPGGIMAGHDYVTQDDGPAQGGQDWTINYDGTKDETGTVVKGAVDKFANEVCRQLTIGYRENGWNTWAMRK